MCGLSAQQNFSFKQNNGVLVCTEPDIFVAFHAFRSMILTCSSSMFTVFVVVPFIHILMVSYDMVVCLHNGQLCNGGLLMMY